MQVMILAAGKSTRLGALGTTLPKPLVPICGYPAIAFGLTLCRDAGLHDVVVNAHHRGDVLMRELGDGSKYGVRIRWSIEDELLGTGGGVAHARSLFQPGPVLVMNGKVVAELDLRAVIEAHRSAPAGALATMVLRADPSPGQFAPVGVDATGAVVSLRGVRTDRTPVGPILERMFTGVHVIEPKLMDRLPAGVSDLIGDAYIPALEDGGRIHSMMMTGYFAEHSTPERYLAGNLDLLRAPALISRPPGPLVGVDPTAKVHPSARLVNPVRVMAGAVIEEGAVVGPEVVVGEGARVGAGARVTKSVLWVGVRMIGEMHKATVTGSGVVPC